MTKIYERLTRWSRKGFGRERLEAETMARIGDGRMGKPGGVSRLWRDRRGVTALEFALIGPTFVMMMFGIVESSIMYYVATTMEGEVQTAARQIRTGNIQQAEDPLKEFTDLLCLNLSSLINCSAVAIDVRTFPDFGSIDRPPLLDEDGEPENENFEPGASGDVVLVRIAYRYQVVTPLLSNLFNNGGGGFIDLYAAAAFQNEPYEGAEG